LGDTTGGVPRDPKDVSDFMADVLIDTQVTGGCFLPALAQLRCREVRVPREASLAIGVIITGPISVEISDECNRDLDEVAGAMDAYRVLEVGFFLSPEIPHLSDNRLRRASTPPATIRLVELPRRSNGETGIENP
jgi:hypothetical protein